MAVFSKDITLTHRNGDEAKISTTTFAGSYGVKLAARVGLIILPLMIPSMSTDEKSVLNEKVDFNKIAKTLGSGAMSEEKILNTVLEIMRSTLIDGKDMGKKPMFDEVFAGNYKLLFGVIKFILEVNYGDFFEEGGIFEMMANQMQTIPPK
jgi:hypothetical protein